MSIPICHHYVVSRFQTHLVQTISSTILISKYSMSQGHVPLFGELLKALSLGYFSQSFHRRACKTNVFSLLPTKTCAMWVREGFQDSIIFLYVLCLNYSHLYVLCLSRTSRSCSFGYSSCIAFILIRVFVYYCILSST